MRVGSDNYFHLTYCTNIHPNNGWEAVLANLGRYAPPLRERLAAGEPFGIGLRLSGIESTELLQGQRLVEFRSFLDDRGLYVFTLNGFPHGPFHGQPVKAEVHAPDWRTEERVRYTLRLIEILAALLPEGMDGGISTSPLSYKYWISPGGSATWELLVLNVVRVAEQLVHVHETQGKLIHLDIEPEPDGLLEDGKELLAFYKNWLLPEGGRLLSSHLGISQESAQRKLLEHIRVCFDTCHVAVVYETPEQVLDAFASAGIQIGKVQLSSALELDLPRSIPDRGDLSDALSPFAESTYLHQVVQCNHDGTLRRYPDLPQALAQMEDPDAAQWRVHFHVPIFVDRYRELGSTQAHIRRTLELLRQRRFTRHLEIETYTWDVLPPDLKADLLESIGREYEWVRNVFP